MAMKEVNAVVGFLPDKVAKAISSTGKYTEPLEIMLERGGDTHVKIRPDDVAGVLVGASQKGETSVQVLLKESASVETVSRAALSDFLKPIRDLSFIKFRPPINVIYIDPQLISRLVDLNRQTLSK